MSEETIKMLNIINDKIKKCIKDNDINKLLAIPLGCHGEFGYLTNEMLNEIIQLQQENQQLKEQVIIMEKYLELITDLSLDYDGCNTIESLKTLIDELDRLACLGRMCNVTETIYVNNNKAYNILHQELEKGDSNE